MDKKFLRRSFLNVIILALLKERPMSGFEIQRIIHKNFDFLLSSGTIYPALYSLKKDKLLKTRKKRKNIIYSVDKKKIDELLNSYLLVLKSLIGKT